MINFYQQFNKIVQLMEYLINENSEQCLVGQDGSLIMRECNVSEDHRYIFFDHNYLKFFYDEEERCTDLSYPIFASCEEQLMMSLTTQSDNTIRNDDGTKFLSQCDHEVMMLPCQNLESQKWVVPNNVVVTTTTPSKYHGVDFTHTSPQIVLSVLTGSILTIIGLCSAIYLCLDNRCHPSTTGILSLDQYNRIFSN